MIPSNKQEASKSNEVALIILFVSLFCLFVLIMSGITEGLAITILGALALGILGWTGNKLRKIIIPPREELCDLLFVDINKRGFKTYSKSLSMTVKKTPQEIPVFIQSRKVKSVEYLNFNIGSAPSLTSIFVRLMIKRFKDGRVFARPNPYWWDDLRTPRIETHPDQPKIIRLVSVDLCDKGKTQPITVIKAVPDDYGMQVIFDVPEQIPAGHPLGKTMRMIFELNAPAEWHGVMHCMSSVDNYNLFTMRRLRVKRAK